MNLLPIDAILPEILEAARTSRGLVLVAPPGAGKTTRVPPALLRSGVATDPHAGIVVLQPRRVAARSVAARIAAENGWELGRQVGYHVRFDRKIGPETRIQVLTEGILNRRLIQDPFLDGIGVIVLDEFHERSLHSDLAVALLREIRETVRDDLILIVMSATMDAGPIAAFLGGLPVIHSEGRRYPVEVEYRPTRRDSWLESAADATLEAASRSAGHVLVFLPGSEEIRRVARRLEPALPAQTWVVPLHGQLPPDEQDLALRPTARQKVILATNIAETSLTIDGVTTVVDSGFARQAGFDDALGLDRLELVRISKASADQRAGRAGRTGPGLCIRLWSERDERGMPAAETAEIHRVDLAASVLALHAWGKADPARFPWFDPPRTAALEAADRLLESLGAIEQRTGRLTELGRQMLTLPVHPRQARLLIASAQASCLAHGAAMAALLAERDIAIAGPGSQGDRGVVSGARGTSDLLERLDLLAEAESCRFRPELRSRGIDVATARRVARVRDDLMRLGRRIAGGSARTPAAEPDEATLLKLLLLAYPDRVTRRRGPGDEGGVMVGGRGVRLAPDSVVREPELFLSLDPREDRRSKTLESKVRIASAIDPAWLAEAFPGSLRIERVVRLQAERNRVEGVRRTIYRDLMIREDRHEQVTPEEASQAVADALRPDIRLFFEADEAASSWLARIAFLREAMPELELPELSDTQLAELLPQICQGCRSLEDARRVALTPLLRGALSYAQARTLDAEAPEALTLPSGNRSRLTYEPGRPPVLAARLQELFGWTDTPRVAGGRIAVLVHLLGPNYRPVQVTNDLRSFWSSTYFQVRKDLRARYPKHSWPEDPTTARPEAKGGRRL